MNSRYHSIAFTDPVLDSQVQYGSRDAPDRLDRHLLGSHLPKGPETSPLPGVGPAPTSGQVAHRVDSARDALGSSERDFIGDQDGFYLATVSDTGWPYVQFRGGARGFVLVLDDHTVAWADFRGNRQYINTGNLSHDPRVAIIFLDYAHQMRLKIFGVARITDVHGDGPYSGPLAMPGDGARIEREVRVDVIAFDWNCPQHITPRYTADQLEPVLAPLRRRVSDLETENQRLRAQPAAEQSPGPVTPQEDRQ